MDTNIHLYTEHDWDLKYFTEVLSSINNLYEITYALNEVIEWSKEYPRYLNLGNFSEFKDEKSNIHVHIHRDYFERNYNNLAEFLINENWNIPDHKKLQLRSIKISSPGDINLDVNGEGVFKQFREFIKDIFYRNNQEKEIGNLKIKEKKLDLIERQLDILEKRGLPPQDRQRILAKAKDDEKILEEAAIKGYLGMPDTDDENDNNS